LVFFYRSQRVLKHVFFIGNDSVLDKIKEFERDIGLTFVDSNEVDSEDSVRFVKRVDPQIFTTTTGSPESCVRKCGEGSCVFDSRGKQTCRCPFGKTGSDCLISKYNNTYTYRHTTNSWIFDVFSLDQYQWSVLYIYMVSLQDTIGFKYMK